MLSCHNCNKPVEYFLIAGRCPDCHCEAKRQERMRILIDAEVKRQLEAKAVKEKP